jgi:CoA:oxalate CoA-transferase
VDDTHGPLAGIRVVELGKMISAPFCGRLLADMGAEVIKIESSGGDETRHVPPYVNGAGSTYRLLNRNKHSVTLDLKSESGAATFHGLVRRSDVLIENLRPGALGRLGFAPEKLLAEDPALVVLSISGFGQYGPWTQHAAYDIVAQAMSGLMAVTGSADGDPVRVGVSMGDVLPGVMAAFAVTSAVVRQRATGRGGHIDLAMLDTLLASLESVGMRALHGDAPIVPTGTHHALSAPYGVFHAKDGGIVIAVVSDALFRKLGELLGHPEWADDPRFVSDEQRGVHRVALQAEIEAVLADRTAAEALALLQAAGIPSAPVLGPREALRSEHAAARGLTPVEPDGFTTLGLGFELTDYRLPLRIAPELGADNHLLEKWLAEPARNEEQHDARAD